ncbi:trigger factor [Pseudahrensia aquimaris]|uniref:Trigger factor n=1 Tax=Pseudahrensia aquimaris TaxID=744461 RepID=A0ABW3FL70_9HYPH
MQVNETLNEGLKREIEVVISAKDMIKKRDERLLDLKDKVKINGFRPGKVPLSHVSKLYGKSVMAELVNETIDENTKKVLAERAEKAAQQPKVSMTEDEAEAEEILSGNKDFNFTISYEVIPPFEIADFSKIKVERPVVEVTDKQIMEQVERIAESNATYQEKKGKAAKKDRVTMDYLGKIEGTPFDGGADTNAQLVLGSNTFIPGFEDQLIGMKAGDEGEVKVSFPEDYPAEHLAGKDAVFDVHVHEVAKPAKTEINDELAKNLGLDDLDKLKEVIKDQISGQYEQQTRQKVKRQLLDELDKTHKFDLPQGMVEQEFNNIWAQITRDLEQAERTFEDEDTTEEKAREDYQKLAERRVRLGLVLAEIGDKAEIQVTEEELQRALYEQVRQYPGQEKEIYDFFRSNPDAVGGLRAPIFEEKVVDHILESAKVTEKTVTEEELLKDDELPV